LVVVFKGDEGHLGVILFGVDEANMRNDTGESNNLIKMEGGVQLVNFMGDLVGDDADNLFYRMIGQIKAEKILFHL